MGEILGLGVTHYPGLSFKGSLLGWIKRILADPALPEPLRSPQNWPAPMREQWADDEGAAHDAQHRQDLIDQFRRARKELDEFQPDFVVLWGDDQYENFRETCVPAFSIMAYNSTENHPWDAAHAWGPNCWDEPADLTLSVKGHRAGGRFLATALLDQGFDIAYAYQPSLADGLGHAFLNSVLFLDWDRQGFSYPIVPITVNSYGRELVRSHAKPLTLSQIQELAGKEEDPPGPQPWRCFQLGGAIARACAKSPWRVALVASSSWSHAFLVPKNNRLYPDVESDRRFYDALAEGEWDTWRKATTPEIEDRGHQELLNWFCLAGAMAELDRKPDYAVFLESWITNSDKVFAALRP